MVVRWRVREALISCTYQSASVPDRPPERHDHQWRGELAAAGVAVASFTWLNGRLLVTSLILGSVMLSIAVVDAARLRIPDILSPRKRSCASTPSEGLTLKLETARIAIVSDDDARLVFFPDGSATGGSVALALGARRVVITVAWINGAASLPGMPR